MRSLPDPDPSQAQTAHSHAEPAKAVADMEQFLGVEATLGQDTGSFEAARQQTIGLADQNIHAVQAPPGYEILGVLGRGGMGVVYKARHRKLNRIVALKMILAGSHAGEGQRTRFLAEAEAAAGLHHPSIVNLLEFGEHQGLPFFTLEYVEGGNLAEKLRGTPQDPKDAARLIETLARAIHYAHTRGIVHRDLKPANVLLADAATPKITDFGLAKRTESRQGLTGTGDVLGTPSYMAPEQAGGETREAGPPADVYALGAILYECLTGRPPFRAATSLETVMQVVRDEPVSVAQLQPGTPADLATICHKCLQKEPRKRYCSALELAEDCAAFVEGRPIRARAVGRIERARRWCRRNPALAASITLSLAFLVAGIVLVTWQWLEASAAFQKADQAQKNEANEKHQAQMARAAAEKIAQDEVKARQEADRLREQAEKERLRAEAALAKARVLLASNQVARADRELAFLQTQEALEVLDAIDRDQRGWEWYYLRKQASGSLLTLPARGTFLDAAFTTDGKPLTVTGIGDLTLWDNSGKELKTLRHNTLSLFGLSVSPDGKWIATASWDHSVRIYDAATMAEVAMVKHDDKAYRVVFSPDSKSIATSSQDFTARVWDLKGNAVSVFRGHRGHTVGLAFTSDSRRVVSAGADGAAYLWEAATGKELMKFAGHTLQVRGVSISPDDRFLATASGDRTVRIWNLEDGKQVKMLTAHTAAVTDVAFSPDGKLLASTGTDRTLRLWETSTWQLVKTLTGHAGNVASVRFNHDGSRLITAGFDLTARVWSPKQATAGQVLGGHKSPITALAANRDGSLVATGAGDRFIYLWDAQSLSRTMEISRQPGAILSLAFHPKEPVLASGDQVGNLKLWDPATGRAIKVLLTGKGEAARLSSLSFSPDGQRLAAALQQRILLFSYPEGKLLGELPEHRDPLWCVAFSPDGKKLASATLDGLIRIDEVETRKTALTLTGHVKSVYQVLFTAEGKGLYSCGEDGTLRYWDLDRGKEVRQTKDSKFAFFDLALHPDGKRLAASVEDRSLRVFHAQELVEVLRIRNAHQEEIGLVRFDGTGQHLFTCGRDEVVKMWSAAPVPP